MEERPIRTGTRLEVPPYSKKVRRILQKMK